MSVVTVAEKKSRPRLLKIIVVAVVLAVVAISLLDLYCVIDLDGLC